MTTTPDARTPVQTGLGVRTLTTIVVGSMVGAGIFSLPRQFAAETGVAGSLVAWSVAGFGTLMLALVFQMLAVRRPDLDAGVYAYAKAGFGEYMGFFSAFGYWASACVGNVTYWVLVMSTLGAVVPALGDGDTPLAVAVASVGLWLMFALVRRGVREATAINRIVTIAKLVPIVVFILIAAFAVDPAILAENWHGGEDAGSLLEQVRGTMLATVFVFLGVEGASTYSRHARKRSDVGRATLLGFASVLALFASVTLVSYGILPADEIAALREPSMAGVLQAVVGSWGGALVGIGLIVSVLGAYLAWTLMAAEVMLVAARAGDMPRFLSRTNAADAPVPALALSACVSQAVLLLTLLSQDAFDFAFDLTSSLVLVPYLLAAWYALRLVLQRSTFADGGHRGRWVLVTALASVYTVWLLYAAGLAYLLIGFLAYAPASVLFVMARREQGRRVFSGRELVVLAVSIAGAVVAVVALATGTIAV